MTTDELTPTQQALLQIFRNRSDRSYSGTDVVTELTAAGYDEGNVYFGLGVLTAMRLITMVGDWERFVHASKQRWVLTP